MFARQYKVLSNRMDRDRRARCDIEKRALIEVILQHGYNPNLCAKELLVSTGFFKKRLIKHRLGYFEIEELIKERGDCPTVLEGHNLPVYNNGYNRGVANG